MHPESAPAPGTVIQRMLKVAALRNGFTYGKLFHQLEEIVSELLRYLWEIPSDAHQSLSERLLLVRLFCFWSIHSAVSNGALCCKSYARGLTINIGSF